MTDKSAKTILIGRQEQAVAGLDFIGGEESHAQASSADALNRPAKEDNPMHSAQKPKAAVEDILTPPGELGSTAAMEAAVSMHQEARARLGPIDPVDIYRNPAIGIGLLVMLPLGAGKALHGALPFTATLDAWEALITMCSAHLGVTKHDLVARAPRPKDKVVAAQTFLVQALVRISGEDAALTWLTHLGFERRWVQRKIKSELDEQLQLELTRLNPQVVFRLTQEPTTESPI